MSGTTYEPPCATREGIQHAMFRGPYEFWRYLNEASPTKGVWPNLSQLRLGQSSSPITRVGQ